eukprot:TRINITY_DN16090_c0_g1_i1.p1 TRINITY_DN16090_c0_g1~~TRINITY_DN16090_c0_g1_i1.p1  ORF type:complete len:111 (-),score=3.34 TRINITY_DN16090_c0_g1_i1:64-396(-)
MGYLRGYQRIMRGITCCCWRWLWSVWCMLTDVEIHKRILPITWISDCNVGSVVYWDNNGGNNYRYSDLCGGVECVYIVSSSYKGWRQGSCVSIVGSYDEAWSSVHFIDSD